MNGIGRLLLSVVLGFGIRETFQQQMEHRERAVIFAQAREYADSVGKPLLNVGVPKTYAPWHPCGDVNIDINPDIGTYCKYQIGDIRDIPYPSKYFGAAYASHVIEHLPTISDAQRALGELHRVADKVFIVSPHKSSIIAWLHPGHHLWVTATGDDFLIEQRGNQVIDNGVTGLVSMYEL